MNDQKIIAFMHKLADEAGIIARRYFRSGITSTLKADQSPVTLADQEIEHKIRELIRGHFPDHGILGEEEEAHLPDAPYQWVIDPIDGTRAFMAGIATFTTLIALCENGVPITGIIDQPILNERWVGKPNSVIPSASEESLIDKIPRLPPQQVRGALGMTSLATTSTAYFTPTERTAFDLLQKNAASTLLGGDAYLYAMLASGHLDVVVDSGLKPYDFAALVPVVTSHGCMITDWQGKPLTLASSGRVLAARTAQLHHEALGILKTAQPV
jgi:inositol-phosphate phosphatase/L-galactose 1-phosphate phosphatase/histidinol-phosphatase|nr:inositol monophosphatase family protein [Rickettsiales bacterium]